MKKRVVDKVFCDGTWRHKYNTSLNDRIADNIDEPSDRTAADTGEEPVSKPHEHPNLLEDDNEPF